MANTRWPPPHSASPLAFPLLSQHQQAAVTENSLANPYNEASCRPASIQSHSHGYDTAQYGPVLRDSMLPYSVGFPSPAQATVWPSSSALGLHSHSDPFSPSLNIGAESMQFDTFTGCGSFLPIPHSGSYPTGPRFLDHDYSQQRALGQSSQRQFNSSSVRHPSLAAPLLNNSHAVGHSDCSDLVLEQEDPDSRLSRQTTSNDKVKFVHADEKSKPARGRRTRRKPRREGVKSKRNDDCFSP